MRMKGHRDLSAAVPATRAAVAPPVAWRAALLALLVIGIACWASAAVAGESEWRVDVLIPGSISVRTPTQEISFGITHDDYPPASFPARYRATSPAGGVLSVEVFSSDEGGWSLLLEIPDLVSATGRGVIRADQVLYRVGGGGWIRGSPAPQVIYTSVGPTTDWLRLDIAFELELEGMEPAGAFSVITRLTALSDAQGP
jgi:hypothetical protein